LSEDAYLADVLAENGDSHFYDQLRCVADLWYEKAALIFSWKHVDKFVDAIRCCNESCMRHEHLHDASRSALGPPFPIPDSSTPLRFKTAPLNHMKREGMLAVLGTTALECELPALCRSASVLTFLENHPWMQHLVTAHGESSEMLALAIVYASVEESNIVRKCICYDPNRLNLWNDK
uniref:Uncharacterized protein n=1 Tax=Globisporangium ultimum (strain ATCC 200006 / CBS 805.95 / DAOM BR144) TaxID=431595 RepID=K3WFM0_GLOUD